MKKSLVALAALAVVGAASAQSTVTVSGALTLGVGTTEFGSNKSGAQIVRQTGNVAFKGSEDLGNGLKANFEVQTTVGQAATSNVTTTAVPQRTLLGDRGAYVNLQGAFGTAQVGRSASAVRALWGAIGDVSGLGVVSGLSAGTSAGTGANASVVDGTLDVVAGDTNARVIYGDAYANQVTYVSPAFNGFTAAVGLVPKQTVASGIGNDTANKDTYSYSLQYANGPIAAAYNLTDSKSDGATATTIAYKLHTLLASYDFGMAKIGLTHQAVKLASGVNPGNGTALTASVPVGAGNIGLGYGKRSASTSTNTNFGDDVKQTFLGYKHNLSKRTNVQLVWNKIDRTGAANDLRETHLIVAHSF